MATELEYISLDKCIDGHLYVIEARNAALGIFNKKTNGFTISRNKLGRNYLFEEYHWDYAGPCGTVRPHEDLGKVPNFPHHAKLMLRFLNEYPKRRDLEMKMIRRSFLRLGITLSEDHFEKRPNWTM